MFALSRLLIHFTLLEWQAARKVLSDVVAAVGIASRARVVLSAIASELRCLAIVSMAVRLFVSLVPTLLQDLLFSFFFIAVLISAVAEWAIASVAFATWFRARGARVAAARNGDDMV